MNRLFPEVSDPYGTPRKTWIPFSMRPRSLPFTLSAMGEAGAEGGVRGAAGFWRAACERGAGAFDGRAVVPEHRRQVLGKKLYVGNLPYNVSSADLQEMFSAYGAVQSAQEILRNVTEVKGR